jgi:hypothetical protein
MPANSDISGSEDEEDNSICVILPDLDRNIFVVEYLSFVFCLTFVRGDATNTFSVDIEDANDESVLEWSGLSLAHFEHLHMLSRILPLIPDKIATASKIAAEDYEDSGSFLLVLVDRLFTDLVRDIIRKNYPATFVQSVVNLHTTFGEIIKSFEDFVINELMINEFLYDCQPVLRATYLYLDWGHPQLLSIQRTGEYAPEYYNSLRNFCLEKLPVDLLNEYLQLSDPQNE